MSVKTGSKWSNWAWDKPVKAFICRSSRMSRPIGWLPPCFFGGQLTLSLIAEQLYYTNGVPIATSNSTKGSREGVMALPSLPPIMAFLGVKRREGEGQALYHFAP